MIFNILVGCNSHLKKKNHIRENEALAIKWALETFRPYVIGTHCIIENDHETLQWLFKATSARLMRWALILQEFDFERKYKQGSAIKRK